MKALMTATALAALVAASSAFGQAQDPSAGTPPAASEPAPSPDAMTPAPATPDTGAQTEAPATPDTPSTAAASDKFMSEQAAEEVMASSFIGSNVENAADENLGSINDIVLAEDGKITAVVIGVGGFLGIGEKNVGVPFDKIEKTTDANGNVVFRLDATAEELEAAPSYVTVAEKMQQQQSQQAPAAPATPAPAQ